MHGDGPWVITMPLYFTIIWLFHLSFSCLMVGASFSLLSAVLHIRFGSHRKSFAESVPPRIDVAGDHP